MFDLAAFDAEITRRKRIDTPGDDTLLANAMREPMEETGVTAFGMTSGTMFGAFALASLVFPAIFRGSAAEAMTFNGMTIEQFAVQMNMQLHDPMLVAMFEQLFMV